MHHSLVRLFCVMLVLQTAFANAVSGHNLRMLNAQEQSHVLIICTGSGTKWIDSDIYFATGDIVEVEQPKDVDESSVKQSCFQSPNFDNKPNQSWHCRISQAAIDTSLQAVSSLVVSYTKVLFYFSPHTRAPPYFTHA